MGVIDLGEHILPAMRVFLGLLRMQIITVSFLAVSAGRDGRAQTETYLGYGGTALMVLDRTPEGISVVRSEIGEIAGRLHKRNRHCLLYTSDAADE